MGEPPCRELGTLIRALQQALEPCLDRPYVLYGHSMGALLAFELARELRRRGRPRPERLAVSGRAAPQLAPIRHHLHSLPDDALVNEIARLGGTPRDVLKSREMMGLTLPLLRSDLEISEEYLYRPEPPLSCPLDVFGGTGDPEVSPAELEAWAEQTDGPAAVEMLPGDHFFPYKAESGFLPVLSRRLDAVIKGLPSKPAP